MSVAQRSWSCARSASRPYRLPQGHPTSAQARRPKADTVDGRRPVAELGKNRKRPGLTQRVFLAIFHTDSIGGFRCDASQIVSLPSGGDEKLPRQCPPSALVSTVIGKKTSTPSMRA